MGRRSRLLVLAALLVGLAACGSPSDEETRGTRGDAPANRPSRSMSVDTPAAAADLPDTLALLPIMVQLEQDMQSISSGLWRHDFEQIAASADNIANHPKIRSADLKTIRSILGDTGFRAFVRDDKLVHDMALELRTAARRENFQRVAETYRNLEKGCISCHLHHRNAIRESPRWR